MKMSRESICATTRSPLNKQMKNVAMEKIRDEKLKTVSKMIKVRSKQNTSANSNGIYFLSNIRGKTSRIDYMLGY